jgi:hypothetical protein
MTNRSACRNGSAALLLLSLTLPALQAQSTKAELFGTVRDPGGLPAGGAAVDLINTGTDAKLSAESDTSGAYHFFACRPAAIAPSPRRSIRASLNSY